MGGGSVSMGDGWWVSEYGRWVVGMSALYGFSGMLWFCDSPTAGTYCNTSW